MYNIGGAYGSNKSYSYIDKYEEQVITLKKDIEKI